MVGDIISERWARSSQNGRVASFRNQGRLAPELLFRLYTGRRGVANSCADNAVVAPLPRMYWLGKIHRPPTR